MLLLSALCAVCGASVAIAFAAPSRTPRHRPAAARRACHRNKRHRCQATHSKKASRHKHRAHKHTKQLTPVPKGQSQTHAQDTPGSTAPTASTPGSTAGSSPSGPNGSEEALTAKPPGAPAPAHVEVTAEDSEGFRFVLSRSSVPAGKTIIEFVNHGQDEHNLNAAEGSEGEVVGSLPNTPSKDHLSLTADLNPGSYTLFCSLPGHAAKGMKATLTVE